MMNTFSCSPQSHADKFLERVLELSADSQIRRRQSAPGSLIWQRLSGAIAAYGQVLRLLSKLQELQEEPYLTLADADGSNINFSTRTI